MSFDKNTKSFANVWYWATYGWSFWGKFDNYTQAEMFVKKYPHLKWKITTDKSLDNIIVE